MSMKHNNNKGIALVSVLMVFVVLFILGVALLQVSMAETREATWQGNRVQAHYLARSGVHHGIELLEKRLTSSPPFTGTIAELATYLQTQAGTDLKELAGVGAYTVQFEEGLYAGEIKIVSSGNAYGKTPSTQTVTYTKSLGDTYNFSNPSGEWMTGINLEKAIKTTNSGESYLGKAVLLQTKNSKNAIQSPKGSSNPSIFQASIIVFREYQGTSLKQITNSIDMTFDSEIILFTGEVLLNKNNTPLFLTVSSDVLRQKTYDKTPGYTDSPSILDYGPLTSDGGIYAVGFEVPARYQDFIGSTPGVSSYNLADFDTTGSYGVMKIGKVWVDGGSTATPWIDDGYYYYKHGTNLQDGKSGLVRIGDGDPIISVLNSLLGVSMGTTPPLWNDK